MPHAAVLVQQKEWCSMAEAAQDHGAAGAAHAVGSWLGQAGSKSLSQHGMKYNCQTVKGTGQCFSSSTAHTVIVDLNCCRRTSNSPLRSHHCVPRQRVWFAVHVSCISPSRLLAKCFYVCTDSNDWSYGCPQNICLLSTLQTTHLQRLHGDWPNTNRLSSLCLLID